MFKSRRRCNFAPDQCSHDGSFLRKGRLLFLGVLCRGIGGIHPPIDSHTLRDSRLEVVFWSSMGNAGSLDGHLEFP